jgi:hypothetical protein
MDRIHYIDFFSFYFFLVLSISFPKTKTIYPTDVPFFGISFFILYLNILDVNTSDN